MRLDELLGKPMVRKVLAAGQERMGEMVGKLLANERVAGGLRSLASSALHARETLEKRVSQALHAASLPSKGDVAELKRRLEKLEAIIDGLADRAGRGPGGANGGNGA